MTLEEIRNKAILSVGQDKSDEYRSAYIDGVLDIYNDTKSFFFIIDKNEAKLEVKPS